MRAPGFAERHPYVFVALVEVMVIAVYMVAGTVAHLRHLTTLQMYGIANLALTAIVALQLTRMRWWKATGFRAAGSPRDLLWYVVPLIPMAINWIPGIDLGSARHLLLVFALTLMVGFVEEAVFRGLMFTALRPLGGWRAVLVPSVLFGVTHSLNVLAGKSGPDALAQVAYAMAIGFAFGALVLRNGLLWPLVLVHFLIDFAHFSQKPGFELSPGWTRVVVMGTTVAFTAYGLWVMRGHAARRVSRA
jgi:membrane protease YdiL (CAAX protease family)